MNHFADGVGPRGLVAAHVGRQEQLQRYTEHTGRDEDPDLDPVESVDFGPPDPDPTCNNGFIKLFSSGTKYNPD